MFTLAQKVMTNLDSILKSFPNKGPSTQGYGFSSSHVWMWELDCKESWVLKNWCFWTVVLEKKTLESPLDCKEIQLVHPKIMNRRLVLKRPQLPSGFQGRTFKGSIWGEGCSSQTLFWLVGGEETGCSFGNLNHQSSSSTSLGSMCLGLSDSHHLPPG